MVVPAVSSVAPLFTDRLPRSCEDRLGFVRLRLAPDSVSEVPAAVCRLRTVAGWPLSVTDAPGVRICTTSFAPGTAEPVQLPATFQEPETDPVQHT